MVSSKAATVEEYLDELPDDRREAISEVRGLHPPTTYPTATSRG